MRERATIARRSLLLAVAGGSLGGCGFEPLYAEGEGGASVQARLAEIEVALIPERSGQLLRQALQSRLERRNAGAARRYGLAVQLALAFEPIAIQPDNSSSRVRMVGSANWVLTAQDPQRRTVASGAARETDGYNIINQQFFAAELTNTVAQKRLLERLADQITTQLALHFRQSASS
jgi:LPS-assembly lipoprotein